MFKSLKRIAYQVHDLPKAKAWYSAILKTEPIFDAPVASIFMVGDCSLSLVASQQPPEDTGRIATYWEVDDVNRVYQTLLGAGATRHTEIRDALNVRTARVIDPFGNVIGLSGPISDPASNSVEKKPSETAHMVTFCRALAFLDPREEIRGNDSYATIFLDERSRDALKSQETREMILNQFITRPLYGYLLARTAFFDHAFKQACSDGIKQIVLLGAGYDTRAIRFSSLIAASTRIYELDVPTTQNRKVEVLKKEGVSAPSNLQLIALNLTTNDVGSTLVGAGFESEKPTLFMWEGVTYYLPYEAINSTLGSLAGVAAAGSVLTFDYMNEKTDSVNASEPFKFWTTRSNLESLLMRHGFSLAENLCAPEFEKKYLRLSNGESAEKPLSRFTLAKAVRIR